MKKPVLLVLLVLLLVPVFAARKALIIGNAAYQSKTLKNPVNDAIDLEAALKDLGFDTTLLKNADYVTMKRGIQKFTDGLNYNDEAIFYFSGHGVQISDINYLIPIGDMTLKDKVDYDAYTIQATWALGKLANAKVSIMILDACRDNPTLTKTMSLKKGLAKMEPETGSQYVIYATEKDTEAFDGEDRNSPFASSLLRNIKSPVAVGDELLRLIRNDVRVATNNQQIPTSYGFLDEPYYLMPPPAQTPERKVQTAQESLPAIPAPPEPQIETVWLYGILEVETNQPGDLYLNGVKRQSLTTGQGSQIRTVTGDYTVELRTAIGNQSRQVSVQKDQTLSLAFRFEKQEQPTLSPQAEAIQTPKPDPQPQAQPKTEITVPQEGTYDVEHSTLAQLKLPQSNNPVPMVKDAPAINEYQPQAGAEVQRKIASRLRFGMKADGGSYNHPELDIVFKKNDFVINGDLYALWQYRQAWLRLGLTPNFSEANEFNSRSRFALASINGRIAFWATEFHIGWQHDAINGRSGYNLRLEGSLSKGSHRLRAQLGYGGRFNASVPYDSTTAYDIIDAREAYDLYYYGPVLYEYEYMGLGNFHPDSRRFMILEIGNHDGLSGQSHLEEASLFDLPLASQKKGAYQLNITHAESSMGKKGRIRIPNDFDNQYYGGKATQEERLTMLNLAWKPLTGLETSFHFSTNTGDQYLSTSDGFISSSLKQDAKLMAGYALIDGQKIKLFSILGFDTSYWRVEVEVDSSHIGGGCAVNRTGGYLAGLLQLTASSALRLQFKLGIAMHQENRDYQFYHYWDVYDSDSSKVTQIKPVFALGFDLNYEKLLYKK